MPRLEYFVVAEEASVDQTTNQFSLFSVVEELQPPGFPSIVPKCCAVVLWHKQPDDEGRDFQCVFRVTQPTGVTNQLETNFRMTNARHRLITRMQGLPILGPGELRFEVLLNGEHVASHIVTVNAPLPVEAPPLVTH